MHEVLYRKYRPQIFKEVVGQESVVEVLEGALKTGKIAHAYLFSGSRGTGKTSIARIFARAIGASEKDTYEIDAASSRGIDDIRELREAVHTLPFESPYKVYIIDEVHMITRDAWNAFLKTLEEPPAHVIFLLATTELSKVPDTILSRCQVFTFKKPAPALLREALWQVAQKEGYDLEPAGATLIALAADGSFRDAFGMLEKVIAISEDKTLSAQKVERAIGAPPLALVARFVEACAGGKRNEALAVVSEVAQANLDAAFFLSLVLARLRAVLLLRHAPESARAFTAAFDAEEMERLTALAGEKGNGITERLLAGLLEALIHIPAAAMPTLPIELALLQKSA